jgi:ligand-binding sensor domain-containing protein/two-component sensor histidine kinase
MKMKLIICLILFFAGKFLIAQAPYLYFSRITTQNGLSHNKVNCILQDKRGFMWMGTDDGLNRYDGRRFVVFRHEPGNKACISGNIISDLVEDNDGVLWIATLDGGFSKYDHRLSPEKQFKQYRNIPGDPNSIPVNIINDLLEDSSGYLWLATGGYSVLRFNKSTEKFEAPDPKSRRTALDMCLDGKGVLWAGGQGGGILKINTKTLAYESDQRYANLYAGMPHATVTALYKDADDHMWFGSWDNVLYRYNSIAKAEEVFNQQTSASFPVEEATSFSEDKEGRLWIGGRYGGLTLYDKDQNQFFNYRFDASKEGSIADDQVNSIFRCRNGMFWIATNKGVSVYNPMQQSFVQTFLPTTGKRITVYDFYEEQNGDLWIGTSNGIYIQKKGRQNFLHLPLLYKGESLSVTKFFSDSKDNFYLGTNYSLFQVDKRTNRISLLAGTENDPVMKKIIDSRVVSIEETTIEGKPVLLVSPYGHFMAYYDLVSQKWISRMDTTKNIIQQFNLKDNLIRKFYKSKSNQLWLANGKMGLGEWTTNSLPKLIFRSNNPAEAGTISNDNVFDIIEDAKNNLWVSTYGGGLNYFDIKSNKFEHIGATNNLLEGIQIDSKEQVWMISNGNLHKYNPQTKSYSSFLLPDLEKSGGVRGNIFKDSKGYMYVAGLNYFIRYKPEAIDDRASQPRIFLTDFRIFNTSYSHLLSQAKIPLRYKQNYFTIEFAAPEFKTGQVQYSYMLEGWDKDWIESGDRNFANYSNLDGGDYTFKVRATNKKGNWGKEVASIAITIVPPFRKTPLFFILCTVVIGVIVYLMYRYRIKELLKRQAIRNRIAQDLHDSVGSTLSSISVYSQVAKIQYDRGNNAELKHVLDRIGVTSTDMISEMNDIVWALNPQNDNMEKIVQRMESFAKPLLKTKDISFNFNYDPNLLQLNLSMEKRKNFYLIFKEAVNNVLKYSNCKNLEISVRLLQQQIEFFLKDDGQGFDKEQLKTLAARSMSGNGLNNMKRRAQEMGGECDIQSQPGKGTIVHLRFPIT